MAARLRGEWVRLVTPEMNEAGRRYHRAGWRLGSGRSRVKARCVSEPCWVRLVKPAAKSTSLLPEQVTPESHDRTKPLGAAD